MFSPQQLLFLPIITALFFLFIAATSKAKVLPKNEVEALRDIANTLGKKDWDFSVHPCSETPRSWITSNPPKNYENNVTCDCSLTDDTLCHVVKISLKSQNLQGRLPPEIVRLPYLQVIDLTRNYLTGSIPEEWGSTNLVKIDLGANRLSGEIPISLGNISSLRNLTVDYNKLSGVLPLELGNLPKIEKFVISSNNFTGELPQTFANLTTLKEFRINDNQFTGQIPKFIQNWKNIEALAIQGSGLAGPIPSEIFTLTKLEDLRISDLNGTQMEFPLHSNIPKMKTLILRSCNIHGSLPEYLAELMTNLKVLDLSFNKLSGEVPSSFTKRTNPNDEQYIYLTGNMLTGSAPRWKPGNKHIDMSYNNFTKNSTIKCPDQIVNLFASSSMLNESTGSDPCIPKCPNFNNFLHINCGGEKPIRINKDTEYEPDSYPSGPSTLFFNRQRTWACSNTGHFLDGKSEPEDYIAKTSSTLLMRNSELYTQARLSPISLTYYAYCMKNGKYNVKLHFAEIMFTNNRSYTNLGRRIFDIYIQGNPVWKDFNIAKEAGGIGKEIIKRYTALVTNNTLQIRLYWAGRGTDAP